MIKCEAISNFTLRDYEKLKNVQRGSSQNRNGMLYKGDTFECDEEMVKYLTGRNEEAATVIKIIEVEPKKVEPLTDNEEPIKTLDVFDTKDESENIIPLDEKAVEKLGKAIEKHIETKPKTSKKKKKK